MRANDIFADSTMEQNFKVPKLKSATPAMVDESPKIPQIYSRLPKGIENGNFWREWNWEILEGGKLRQFWQEGGRRGSDSTARGWEPSDLLPLVCCNDLTNIGTAWMTKFSRNVKLNLCWSKISPSPSKSGCWQMWEVWQMSLTQGCNVSHRVRFDNLPYSCNSRHTPELAANTYFWSQIKDIFDLAQTNWVKLFWAQCTLMLGKCLLRGFSLQCSS